MTENNAVTFTKRADGTFQAKFSEMPEVVVTAPSISEAYDKVLDDAATKLTSYKRNGVISEDKFLQISNLIFNLSVN